MIVKPNQAIDDAIKEVAAIKEAMLDSGATSNFIQSADGLELTSQSSKTVSTANGHVMKATMTALLPLRQLKAGAREAIVIPEMSTKALMSSSNWPIKDTPSLPTRSHRL